ncbi:MAG: isoprenylcysteine carboxylmethyltransferase family protein [Planctomycetaceae bacterium]
MPITMVVLACLAIVPLPNSGHDSLFAQSLEVSGLVISFLGLLLRCMTIGHTPAGTSGRNTERQVAVSLNTTGVYSIVRHPLYLANFLIGLGLAVFTLNPWFVATYILTFWLYYERIMMAEEQFLLESFGTQFSDWADRTPAFIPCFRNHVRSTLPFSFRNVLRREYNTVLQIVVVSFILELIGDAIDQKKFQLSMPWIIFLCSGLAVWGILRTLKRHTHLLDVPGR